MTLDRDPWIGCTLASQFQIIERLGAGGMGAVYLANQLGVDRRVVIKVMLPELSERTDSVERFTREAKAVARLNHPNIVQIHVFGQSDDGALFLAMEYVDGRSLTQVIGERGALAQSRALRITDQILSALGQAHVAGVVHRDLKPDNIMLCEQQGSRDFVKILDFGIAKMVGDAAPNATLTQQGIVTGTPRYMSPEQARAVALDARSDIYTLGIILYEMLTGEHPYQADSAVDYLVKHITEPVPAAARRFGDLAILPRVDALLSRAVAKEPSARYQSAAEMQREVRRALRDLPDALREFPTPGDADTPRAHGGELAHAATVAYQKTGATTTRPRWPWFVAIGAVLVLLGGGAAWLLSSRAARSDDTPAPTTTAAPASAAASASTEAPTAAPPGSTGDDVGGAPTRPPLAEATPIDGLPIPAGATLMSRTPQALVLQGRLDPRDVLAFYRSWARDRFSGVQEMAGGLVIGDPEAPVSSVFVMRQADGLMISLSRNVLAEPPPDPPPGSEPFGVPRYPGAGTMVETPQTIVYTVRAPIETVIDFYHDAYRGTKGATLVRADNDGQPLLAISSEDPEVPFRALSVMIDPQVADGSRVMISVSGR